MPARAVDPAEAIELDLSLFGHRGVTRALAVEKAVDEFRLDHRVRTSMEPDVEPGRLARIVVVRKRDAVGQDGAVDFGNVAVDLPFALIPLRLVRLKLMGALDALIESGERAIDC